MKHLSLPFQSYNPASAHSLRKLGLHEDSTIAMHIDGYPDTPASDRRTSQEGSLHRRLSAEEMRRQYSQSSTLSSSVDDPALSQSLTNLQRYIIIIVAYQ